MTLFVTPGDNVAQSGQQSAASFVLGDTDLPQALTLNLPPGNTGSILFSGEPPFGRLLEAVWPDVLKIAAQHGVLHLRHGPFANDNATAAELAAVGFTRCATIERWKIGAEKDEASAWNSPPGFQLHCADAANRLLTEPASQRQIRGLLNDVFDSGADLPALLNSPTDQVRIWADCGDICKVATFHQQQRLDGICLFSESVGVLKYIGVRSSQRRTGMASELLRAVLASGDSRLAAMTFIDEANEVSRRFFAACGFVLKGKSSLLKVSV